MTTCLETLRKTSQRGRKTKPMKGDATVTPDNLPVIEQGIEEERQVNATSLGYEDAESLLSWRQGAPLSQAVAERSEMSTRLTTTQFQAGTEGMRPSIKQTTPDEGLLMPTMTLISSMGIYPSNYYSELEDMPPAEMSDGTCWE